MERERRLLSCLRREGLGEPEELPELELELREVLELPERLDAEGELQPLLEPVLKPAFWIPYLALFFSVAFTTPDI